MMENHQTLRTSGIPTNRSSGRLDEDLETLSIGEDAVGEREEPDIHQEEIFPGPVTGFPGEYVSTVSISEAGKDEIAHPDLGAGHLNKTRNSVLVNKDGEDEREETNIHQVDMNSDLCAEITGHQDGRLHTVYEEEYEMDVQDNQQVVISSDRFTSE
ncbi:uncharacterized protein O3C94_020650 [Discoglossus pictus]